MRTILHTEASTGFGGQEMRILLEMEEFQNHGHRMLLACQPGSHILTRAREKGFTVHQIKMRNSVDPLAILPLYRLMRKENVAIVHTHSSLDSWTAGLAARLAGVPLIVRTRHVSIPIKNKLVYTWLADKVITTGDTIKQYLENRCGCNGSKVISIPTGVDLSRFQPEKYSGTGLREELGLEPRHVLIGIIGMIRWCKGLDVFLDSAKSISQKHAEAKFIVVGFDPDGKIDFAEEIRKQNLQGSVHYLGFREDIPEILASLDVLVSASTAAEGVSQAILQALAMNKAVIATRIGGSPEVVHHRQTGLLVDPNDAAALAAGLAELIASPELRKTCGEAGGEWVRERFSVEQMIDRIEQVYQ